MLPTFISILAILAISPSAKASDKDGFNYYKDFLRGRSDEVIDVGDGERMLYFYRTPLQLLPGLLPALEQEYRKRTANAYKNHMMNKEFLALEAPLKRSSCAIIDVTRKGTFS